MPRANDTAAAIRQYETAVRSGEKSGVAANNLAWLYAAQGNPRALEYAEHVYTFGSRGRHLVQAGGGSRVVSVG